MASSLFSCQTGNSFAVFGFTHLVDQSVFDQQDAVGCLSESVVVRDHYKGHAAFAIHFAHQGEDFFAGTTVEITGELVGQHDLRSIG